MANNYLYSITTPFNAKSGFRSSLRGGYADHQQLLELKGPAIIIAGSGMCTGGRIVAHLKRHLENPATDILFVGYQATGTTGRDILTYAGKPGGHVRIDGESRRIRASVHALGGYSANADGEELLQWAAAVRPGDIKLVNGEATAQAHLNRLIQSHLKPRP
ncbi:MAG: MBL fold metallo-hydrolase RNA specificity domain-containing protein [Pseudomonadota bacterium]